MINFFQNAVRFFALICLLSLIGCGGHADKSIIDLTNRLEPEGGVYHEDNNTVASSTGSFVNFYTSTNFLNKTTKVSFDLSENALYRTHKLSNSTIITPPVLGDNGVIFFLSEKLFVYAYDLENHKILWGRDIANVYSKGVKTGITVHGNRVYVSLDRDLVVLHADSGKEIVRKQMPDLVSACSVLPQKNGIDLLIIQTLSNQTVAYEFNNQTNSISGSVKWFHEMWHELLRTSSVSMPITLSNEKVGIEYSSGQFFALNTKNGEPVWMIDMLKDAKYTQEYMPLNTSCQSIFYRDHVYIAGNNNIVSKIDMQGKDVWQRDCEDVQSMSIMNDTMYVTNNAKQAAAIDLSSGKVIWASTLHDKNNTKRTKDTTYFFYPIQTQDGVMVISKDGTVNLLNASDGALKKVKNLGRDITSFVIFKDKLILFSKNYMISE